MQASAVTSHTASRCKTQIARSILNYSREIGKLCVSPQEEFAKRNQKAGEFRKHSARRVKFAFHGVRRLLWTFLRGRSFTDAQNLSPVGISMFSPRDWASAPQAGKWVMRFSAAPPQIYRNTIHPPGQRPQNISHHDILNLFARPVAGRALWAWGVRRGGTRIFSLRPVPPCGSSKSCLAPMVERLFNKENS